MCEPNDFFYPAPLGAHPSHPPTRCPLTSHLPLSERTPADWMNSVLEHHLEFHRQPQGNPGLSHCISRTFGQHPRLASDHDHSIVVYHGRADPPIPAVGGSKPEVHAHSRAVEHRLGLLRSCKHFNLFQHFRFSIVPYQKTSPGLRGYLRQARRRGMASHRSEIPTLSSSRYDQVHTAQYERALGRSTGRWLSVIMPIIR